MRKPTGTANYITSPPIIPTLPATVTTSTGRTYDTREALPIARAVLMASFKELKKIPGGAQRTQYVLERACFHLKRVQVAPREPPTPA